MDSEVEGDIDSEAEGDVDGLLEIDVDGLTDSLAEGDILSDADSEDDSLILADGDADSDKDSEADSEADSLVEVDALSDIPSIKVTKPLTTVTLFPSKEVKISVAPLFPDIVTIVVFSAKSSNIDTPLPTKSKYFL